MSQLDRLPERQVDVLLPPMIIGPLSSGSAWTSEGLKGDENHRAVVDPQGRVERGREMAGNLHGLGRRGCGIAEPEQVEVGIVGQRYVQSHLQAERRPTDHGDGIRRYVPQRTARQDTRPRKHLNFRGLHMDPVYGTVNRLSSDRYDRWSGWRFTGNHQRPSNHAQELSDDRESETRSHEVRILLDFPMLGAAGHPGRSPAEPATRHRQSSPPLTDRLLSTSISSSNAGFAGRWMVPSRTDDTV